MSKDLLGRRIVDTVTYSDGTVTKVVRCADKGDCKVRILRIQDPWGKVYWNVQRKGPQWFVLTGNSAPSDEWLNLGSYGLRRAAVEHFEEIT